MSIVIYKKVKKIHSELEEYRKLRNMCDCAYKKCVLTKKFLWLSTDNQDEVVLCDSELTNIIREYCDKKINKLEGQLNYDDKKYGRLFSNNV